MLQFLAPVVGNLIGSLFMPKTPQPQAPGAGMDITQMNLVPGTMPGVATPQNNFNWSNILGGVLSLALGGGGQMSPMSMGGMGGGMGNPFAMGNMMGGLGGFMGYGGAQMMPKTMAATNNMIDVLNGEGESDVADAHLNILDTAT